MTTKFSQFVDGSQGRITDSFVAVRDGVNTRFTLSTGINDDDGNVLVGLVSGGALAVNYPQFLSSLSGNAVMIRAQGADADIQLDILSVGGGDLRLVPGSTGEVFVDATTSIKIAAGTTGQRPTGSSGAFRYNTTTDLLEYWDLNALDWETVSSGSGTVASVTGTANEIDVGGTAADPVLSLPSTLVAPGSVGVTSLTASRAVVSDGSKILTSSAVTSTELGYLSGATSNIQTQINNIEAGQYQENFVINSNFYLWPFGTSITAASSPVANSDDNYICSQWILLSDGNDIVDATLVTAAADVPEGAGYAIKLEVETANAKFGLFQPFENIESAKMAGTAVSVSFDAKNAAADDLTDVLKAAVLAWDSTANSITSDVVSAWNADLTTPTFATNWTAENTPSNLSLTQSYQTFTIENIDIDTSGTTNVGLFVWCDNADGAVDDAIFISKVKLEISENATPYEAPIWTEDFKRAQRFIKTSFPINIAPQQNYGVQTGEAMFPAIQAAGGVQSSPKVQFDPAMLGAATITFYNPAAANANIRDESLGADGGAVSAAFSDEGGFVIATTGNASTSITNGLGIHYLAYNLL